MAQLQFKGKTFVQNHHLLVKYHELVPVKAKSLTDKVTLHDNLIIHGDNLKALKALLPLYAGQIDCIYIDPPYNTGNEKWAYNDNVNSPMMQEWLGKVVDREDLTRHDKWLCMMMPRLKLLRELMADDGVIFLSIDDNEVHHLRMMMDEVFGEEDFVAQIIWQKKYAVSSDDPGIGVMHDYVIVYRRSGKFQRGLLPRTNKQLDRYTNPDSDPRGVWSSDNYVSNKSRKERPTLWYPIMHPKTGAEVWPEEHAVWRYSSQKHQQMVEEQRLYWGPDQSYRRPRMKRFLSEIQEGIVPSTWWPFLEVGHNDEAQKETGEILGRKVFNTPKPVRFLSRLLQIGCGRDGLILDSFAGSGSTAQAVLSLNARDGGRRRFILIECEDYADTITAERVRRVIKGVPTAKDEVLKKGLGGTFSFFKLGKAVELDSILEGDSLPTYEELVRYVFYTATGEEFDEKAVDEKKHFIGESRNYQVFLFYEPDVAKLKNLALTLDMANALPKLKDGKRRLVFAPTKYLDQEHLDRFRIDFAQLPFEIYELTR